VFFSNRFYSLFVGRELLKPLLHLCQFDQALDVILPLIDAFQTESPPAKLTMSDLGWLHNSAAIMFTKSGRLQHALVHCQAGVGAKHPEDYLS